MDSNDSEITVPRAIMAIIAGPLVGGAVLVLERFALAAFYNSGSPAAVGLPWWWGPGVVLIFWLFASAFFGFGLMTVGVPAWIALDHLKRRSCVDAVLLGGILSFIAYLLLAAGARFPLLGDVGGSYWALFRDAIEVSIAGSLAGFSIWLIAYGGRAHRRG
jgi:hypothetical protein